MSRVPAGLWKDLIAIQIYGANTGVGKTVFSTLLGAHFAKRKGPVKWTPRYIKPISTGPADEADDSYVKKYSGAPVTTLFQFGEPVSPHVAARGEANIPNDDYIATRLSQSLRDETLDLSKGGNRKRIAIVETAGGVLSPGPMGNPQVDLYRPLRLPAVLVGDHRLGGISSTISAAESLILRGYDIDAVVIFNDNGIYENADYLTKYFMARNISAFELPWIPSLKGCSSKEEGNIMKEYYDTHSVGQSISRVGERLIAQHKDRRASIRDMARRTSKTVWHPFTQHKSVERDDDILVFDSAYGDFFQTKRTDRTPHSGNPNTEPSMLYPAFDGSASWWTQGLGHGNPQLALAAAYAAGRYGHVMFAGATNEPAITLAEQLLKDIENPRLTKCFYSDDGSTAAEVGIKMALRAASKRYEWDGSTEEIGIIGLKGSYHGDTIGAMDASEPCVYNKKVDWYRGRGYWFDFPTVKMRNGKWLIEPPTGMEAEFGPAKDFQSLNEVFDFDARDRSASYEKYIQTVLNELVFEQGWKFGALVMEPVILGAGGMFLVDPLFQRTLVEVVRQFQFSNTHPPVPTTELDSESPKWSGLPVLFDEVFTGLYRLGRYTSSSFLRTHPDISIHAKLLTGGLVPLSVTLASQSIFDAFWGDEKADALLHGHSYTAHPIGCHVANTSLQQMRELTGSHEWKEYRKDWQVEQKNDGDAGGGLNLSFKGKHPENDGVWSMWSTKFVENLSHHPRIDHVMAIGSVLAMSLKDASGSGYTSNAAIGLRDALLNDTVKTEVSIHSRVLGNVLYLMASMTSKPKHLTNVEETVLAKLDRI